MSQLKAKQIAGPSSGRVGSAILFDGTTSGWSADLNTALALPSGPTSARPQAPVGGHVRFNNETHKLEIHNGTTWTDVGLSKFSELTDGPGALQAGKGLRVNAGGTAVEHYDISNASRVYRFRVNFNGATTPTDFAEVPAGWNVSFTGSTVNITHNITKPITNIALFGALQASNNYQMRQVANTGTTLPTVIYDGTTSAVTITNITTTNTSSYNGGHCYIYLHFPA